MSVAFQPHDIPHPVQKSPARRNRRGRLLGTESCVKTTFTQILSESEIDRCDSRHRAMGFFGVCYNEKHRGRHDNSRLCGNRRSARLGRVGSGGLDSARQVVVSRRSVNGDTTEREGREKRHSKRERDTECNSNGVGKTVCLHVRFLLSPTGLRNAY